MRRMKVLTKPQERPLFLILTGFLIAGTIVGLSQQPSGESAKTPQTENSSALDLTQLQFVRYIQQPFRLLFNAWDGDPKKPESLIFQITTIDIRQPDQFLKIGDVIAGTRFKVTGFEAKRISDLGSGGDVSELTLWDTEARNNVILVLGRIVNSPDSYALFRYLRNNIQFPVKIGSEFTLPPETNLRYKLLNVTKDEALIETPAGQKVKVQFIKP
jgi:hypothetical protein